MQSPATPRSGSALTCAAVSSESAGDDSDSSVPDVPFEKGCTHPSVDDGVSTWAGPEHDEDVEREDTARVLEGPRRSTPASHMEVMKTFVDDCYDPRMPQFIRQARREEVIWGEIRFLREQVARIEPILEARRAAGHDEALLAGYRQVLAEARLRIPDLEWAYSQSGKWSKDSMKVPVARGLHRFALCRPHRKHEIYFAGVASSEDKTRHARILEGRAHSPDGTLPARQQL